MKCAKNWRNMTLKHYSSSTEKVIFKRWSLLGAFCPQYIDTLIQSVSLYLGQKASKRLHLIKENFFGREAIMIEVIYINF